MADPLSTAWSGIRLELVDSRPFHDVLFDERLSQVLFDERLSQFERRRFAFEFFHPPIIIRCDRSHHAIPKGKVVSVVVFELGVVLIVVGRAKHRPGIARGARGEIFKARVPKGAVDLVEEPMRQKNDRRERHEEGDDGIVALRQRRIHKPDRIVAPHGRRDAAVMQQVILVESLGVQQPVSEVEPGVEEHHAKQEQRHGCPPAEVPG